MTRESRSCFVVVPCLALLLGGTLYVAKSLPWLDVPAAMVVGYTAAAIIVYLWFRYVAGFPPAPMVRSWFGPCRFRGVGIGILAGIGLFVLGGIGYAMAGLLGLSQIMPAFPDSIVWVIAMIVAQVTLAPLIEEVVFRGYILERASRLLPGWVATVYSAALFSFYHLSVPQVIPTFMIGLGLAFLMQKFRTLWVPLIAHVSYNLIGLNLAYLTGS